MTALGRIGGKARAKKMSAEERRASALKASKAAAEARTKKAQGLSVQPNDGVLSLKYDLLRTEHLKGHDKPEAGSNQKAPATDQEVPDPTNVVDRMNAYLLTDFMSITELPESVTELELLRQALDHRLYEDFFSRVLLLPRAEQQLIAENPPASRRKLDLYIREAARQYGARLFLSTLVMERVWAWVNGEESGSQKLGVLFDRMRNAASLQLGRGKGKTTDRFRIARKDLVLQLATLQARLRKEWPESAEDIRRFISKEIDESRLSLPHLKINRKSLLRFLDDDGIAIDFRGQAERSNDDLSPSQFYVKWAASSLRRSPEPVRQDLTKPTRPLEQTQRK